MEEYPMVLEDFPELKRLRKMSSRRKRGKTESRCRHRRHRKLTPSTMPMDLKCDICGRMDNLTAHHKIPVSEGGNNSPDNIAVLCTTCHDLTHGRNPHRR